MADASIERLHELVDALPESKIEAAKKYLESLVKMECDPLLQTFLDAPEDDEPVTEQDLRDIEENESGVSRNLSPHRSSTPRRCLDSYFCKKLGILPPCFNAIRSFLSVRRTYPDPSCIHRNDSSRS